MLKTEIADRVKSLEVGSIKNHPRAWLRFVQLILNRLSKEQNLIKSRPTRVEIGLPRRENRHQSTAGSTWGVVPGLVWVGSKWLLAFPRVPVTPGTPLYFFAMLPPERPQKGSSQLLLNLSLVFFSLVLLYLLILLLLLMSGNVHPNPGPIFPCSVCAGNVTWQGQSVQCCACSKWVHLKCSQLSLSQFRALGNSHFWSCPLPNHCDSLLGILRHVHFHCAI